MNLQKWDDVNWELVQKRVFRYQRRIYEASKRGDKNVVKALQIRLISSIDSKLLAIEQATNNLNDVSVNLNSEKKLKILQRLKFTKTKQAPISKINSDINYIKKQKIENEAKNNLCLLALEPEWEGLFLPNCYGYRPEKTKHDAIAAVNSYLKHNESEKELYSLTFKLNVNDIFYSIDPEILLNKMNTTLKVQEHLRSLLQLSFKKKEITKIGIRHKSSLLGKAKDKLISFLLTLIVNDLLEFLLKVTTFYNPQVNSNEPLNLHYIPISYGSNIVIIGNNLKQLEKFKTQILHWITTQLKIEFKEDNLKIKSLFEGFEFLGHSFILIKQKSHRKFKYFPSRKSQQTFLLDIREIIQKNKASSSYQLINNLKPKILAWGKYYRYSDCRIIFRKMSHYILQKLRAWAFRINKKSGRKVVKEKYFPSNKKYYFEGVCYHDNWILNGKKKQADGKTKENCLINLAWIKQRNWVQVDNLRSIYDEDQTYWRVRNLLVKQKNKNFKPIIIST